MTYKSGRLMDIARGAYAHSPHVVRATLGHAIAFLPTRLKFGRTYWHWRQIVARAETDLDFAAAQHLDALRRLLAKAHEGSPFYRDLIDRAFDNKFDANRVTLEDVRRLPILTKEDLSAAGDAALAVPKQALDRAETSGSNGEKPFAFYLDKDRSTREMAFVYNVWSRTGFSEDERRATLRGVDVGVRAGDIHGWDPALRELRLATFPLTPESAELYLDLIDKRRIRYLYGYPSAIEILCRNLHHLGRRPKLPLKGILLISEPVYAHQRQIYRQTFGDVPVSCFYGMSEKVLFASEVNGQPDVYEFNPLYGLAELVDAAGNPVTEPGREGRLIGTGFLSTGMPFIRYDTKDFARLVELPSPANGQRLKVKAIAPRRKPGILIGRDGGRIVIMALTSEDPDHYGDVQEFQFYQDTPGEVLFRYMLAPGGDEACARKVADRLANLCQGRVDFRLEQVERLASGRGGKRAFVDQRLDLSLD
ncbi:capsular polysaccharide biosynthesis protein CapK [Brucella endophytica]|uniref:Capsular polysaccharide biosynthesis protein CapK n=1 Tax=Brucella endophytica TaxID=1963359 RepID=A0A916WKT0_9HYPH|nr:phenylacetate--CoA ligase family protein [Brucella endophytica]GGB07446.1 capsular polysaccharide biosynthesis protein CapK [Brucella endophytica]